MNQLSGLLLVLLLATCTTIRSEQKMSQSAATNKARPQTQVTLNVYSGRRNPTWLLSEEQTTSLLSILQELPAASESNFFNGLGYRGFQVMMANPASQKPGEILVYKGQVRYSDGCNIKYLADKDRRIERLLLKSGNSHLGPSLYRTVEREIQPAGK